MGETVGHTRVWIVDDSPLDAERARCVLEPSYAVQVFRDGSALLEQLTVEPPPDVLVLDWVMPGVTGIEVCRFLRGGAVPQMEMAILLLTMQTDVQQIVEGLAAGANDYLVKPYADPELLARVDALVRWNRLLDRAQKAEASLLELLEHAPDPLLRVDGQGVVTYTNGEAQRALGSSRGALEGQPLASLLPDLARQDLADAFRLSRPLPDIAIGDQVYSPTVRSLPSDRQVGRIGSTIGMRNVTDRRQKEARRLDFYSIIAHDLRSPLASLLMRTELLLRGHRGVLPDAVAADLRRMDSNMKSLVALINDFLDFARMDEAAARIEREPLALAALIGEIVEEFRPLADSNSQRLTVELLDESMMVMGDRQRLKQAVTNLLSNAVKFTSVEGNIVIRASTSQLHVEVAVEDDGPGIAPEVLPALFQRYSRAPHRQNDVGGTGLGLLIVREIVEAHGGSVGVESSPGAGSRFWFRLPAPLRGEASAPVASAPAPGEGGEAVAGSAGTVSVSAG